MIEWCAAKFQYTRLPKNSSLHAEETSNIDAAAKAMNSEHRLAQTTEATACCSRIAINFFAHDKACSPDSSIRLIREWVVIADLCHQN
jgi:hypothetical protein